MKWLSWICILIASVCYGQKNTYKISGVVKNIIGGKIYLFSSTFSRKFYGKNDCIDSANINNGIFEIIRKYNDNNIYAYRVVIKSDSIYGVTGLVFIEPKDQFIKIDTLDEYISPHIKNSAVQNEMKFEYEVLFKTFIARNDSLNNLSDELYKQYGKNLPDDIRINFDRLEKKMISQGDSLFGVYVKGHQNSFVSLWKLIDRFNNFGYKENYGILFNFLSNEIKKSTIAKLFLINLNNAKKLAVNNYFPRINLKNSSGEQVYFTPEFNNSEYTLIDFWFSNCGPCISQFPLYKKLFILYNNSHLLNIIGISIDFKKDFNNWKNLIVSQNLLWQQYLDEDGKWSNKMNITSFPTNFLLNKKGIIIQRNILPQELQNILINQDIKKSYFDKIDIGSEPF